MVFILFYNFVEINILLHTFLLILFAWYEKYIISQVWFRFSDVLSAFTCASTIGNLWNVCLGVNILSSLLCSLNLSIFFCKIPIPLSWFSSVRIFFSNNSVS